MKRRPSSIVSLLVRRWDFLGDDGGVAVELGLLASFFLVPLLLGIIQYGLYFNATQSLAAATRVGAEYARDSTTCQDSRTGISILSNSVGQFCQTGIQYAIQASMNFSPALPAPTVTLTCQCDDGTAITCGNNSCASAGRPAPNRVFVTISQTQTFTPFVALWTVPTTINGTTDIRIQ